MTHYNHQSDFWSYISKDVLGGELPTAFKRYEDNKSLYVLSGVIRDYYMGKKLDRVRDVDFVVDEKICFPKAILNEYQGKRNTFGGVKLIVNEVAVDVWSLGETWGIIDGRMKPDIESLLKSVFFNCTAIVYDVAQRAFIADESFKRFVEEKELDIVYEKNPNEPLCVVNAFYYHDKYQAHFTNRLRKWIVETDKSITDYESVEQKHFHKIIYTNSDIKKRIIKLTEEV